MDNLYDTLSRFVADVCAGRDESHGHAHMKKVTETSLYILENLGENELRNLVMTVAWLHDVADHKYNVDKIIVNDFVATLYDSEQTQLIMNIIDRISYSKENEYGTSDWEDVLGKTGLLVRDVVSDADKLEAIGKAGLERCAQYLIHKGITKNQLVQKIIEHCNDKLLKLYDEYIRTSIGKELAKPLHEEMIQEIIKLQLSIAS